MDDKAIEIYFAVLDAIQSAMTAEQFARTELILSGAIRAEEFLID